MAYEVFGRNIHPLVYIFYFDLVWKFTEINFWILIFLQNAGNGGQERVWVLLNLKNNFDLVFSHKNNCDFLLRFPLPWSWFFFDFLARIIPRSILARNPRNPRSWQKMKKLQDLGKKFKIIQDYQRSWQKNEDAKHWVAPILTSFTLLVGSTPKYPNEIYPA